MKYTVLTLFLFFSLSLCAQRSIPPTTQLLICGEVMQEIEFGIQDLPNFRAVPIPDLILKNHQGEIKDTVTHLQGFLLTALLKGIEYPVDKPRELNEFYFTIVASDGYKVVFSYNEIFNTETGDSLYLVTRINDQPIEASGQGLLIVSAKDKRVGARYIKGVEKIVVSRVH